VHEAAQAQGALVLGVAAVKAGLVDMTIPRIEFEGRLKAIGATSTKDGNWTKVEFQVHPSDDVSEMLRAGLNSRWLVVVVQLDDQDQPVTPEKPKGGELAKRAGILCSDSRFWAWSSKRHEYLLPADPKNAEGMATAYLRIECDIKSRAELDHNPEAAEKFKALEFEFKQAYGLVAERTQ
jgi:hypothetical protein